MAAALSSSFPFLIFARLSASVVAVLVVIWALHFKSSFIPQSPSQEEHIYAVRKRTHFSNFLILDFHLMQCACMILWESLSYFWGFFEAGYAPFANGDWFHPH